MSGLVIDGNGSRDQNNYFPNPPIDPEHDHRRHSHFNEHFELRRLIDFAVEYRRLDFEVLA